MGKQETNTYQLENSKCTPHHYQVDHFAYIIRDGVYHKLEGNKLGPYYIMEVFTNHTIQIQKGIVNKFINIRRLLLTSGLPPLTEVSTEAPFFLFFFLFFSFFFSFLVQEWDIDKVTWEVNTNTGL